MTSNDEAGDFLKTEDAASQLLNELTELRKETLGYSEAHAALGATAASMGELIVKVSQTASGIGDTARSLREIGTPELLAGQEKLLAAQLATSQAIAAVNGAIRRIQRVMLAGFGVTAVLLVVAIVLSL